MNLRNKKILVTGGAGFIGSHLVEELVEKGALVTVIDDLSNGSTEFLPPKTKLIKIELPHQNLPVILKRNNFYAVFHLAGDAYVPPSVELPLEDLKNNTAVTVHLLEAIRKNSPKTKVIYFSSVAIYGNPEQLPIKETHPFLPISPYGVSKLAAERYVNIYAFIHKLNTVSLRLFSVFGPRQKKQVVFDLIDKLHKNPTDLFMHGRGTETRDFVYVKDVVQAALLVLGKSKMKGEVYNVASGHSISIRDLIKATIKLMNLHPKINFSGCVRPGDALCWSADIKCLRSLGYRPSFSLKEGLKNIIEWYSNIYSQKPQKDKIHYGRKKSHSHGG